MARYNKKNECRTVLIIPVLHPQKGRFQLVEYIPNASTLEITVGVDRSSCHSYSEYQVDYKSTHTHMYPRLHMTSPIVAIKPRITYKSKYQEKYQRETLITKSHHVCN